MNLQVLPVVNGVNASLVDQPLIASNNIQPFERKNSASSSIHEVFQASSFKAGFRQIQQEVLMQFLPKALVSILSGRFGIIPYEALLEGSEYIGLYCFPTLIAAGGAKIISNILGLPHFSLLGKPFHELESSFKQNKPINNIRLNKSLLAKCALGQLMTFILTAAAGVAAQLMATAPRVLFIENVAGDSNFYALAGLNVSDEQKEQSKKDYATAKKHAWENLNWGFWGLLALIPSVFGFTHLLGAFAEKLPLERLAKTFMLNKNFDISKFATVFNLAIAPWAYGRTALNSAAKAEDLNRLYLFSIPAVLFFQPFLETILTLIIGKTNGISKPLMPLKEVKSEINAGKREIWNISLYNKEHLMKQMSHFEPIKQEKILKRIEFFNDKGVLGFALLWGLAIQVYNVFNTKHKHAQELQAMKSDSKHSKKKTNNSLDSSKGLTSQQFALA